MKKNYKLILWLLPRFILWRVFLLVVALYAINAIPFKPSFPYWETLLEPQGHPLFWSWANFDGVHYLYIAAHGYSAQYTQAFFPAFPLFVRYLSLIIQSPILVGLLISHVSFFIALLILYKLVKLDRGDSTAKRVIYFMLLFPTSFYFVSFYTESLFLALFLGSLYFARRRHWWLAGILGAIASATRLFGIFLLPMLLLEWYWGRGKKSVYTPAELLTSILPISLVSTGLLTYMYYLHKSFSDALLFLHVQPAFGAERSADKLILIYQVFWRYLKMLTTIEVSSLVYYVVSLEFITAVLFLILSLLAIKYTRPSYALFSLLAFFTPTLTGTFSSLPRYVLIIFPAFIVLGLIKDRRFQRLWWLTSVILLAVNTALFIRGYWVA